MARWLLEATARSSPPWPFEAGTKTFIHTINGPATAIEARERAPEECGDEGQEAWLWPGHSTCVEVVVPTMKSDES